MWTITAILACQAPEEQQTPEPTPPPTPTGTPPEPEPTIPPEPTTPTILPPDPCGALPGLTVTGASATQPWHENEARVAVTFSAPASAAVRCTLASDPGEIHLVESAATSSEHMLDLSGLLGSSTYDCTAVPVCPSSLAEPYGFTLVTGAVAPIFPGTTVTGEGGDEYILANDAVDCSPWPTNHLLVFDREGRPRWWSGTPAHVGPSLEFRYHGDDVFVWGGGWEPTPEGRPRRIDLYDGEIYDSVAALGTADHHHDGKQLADGRLLTLEEVLIDEDNGDTFRGFQVRRVNPVLDLVDFTYDSQRAYDEGHLPGGNNDVWHANWMDIAEVAGREVLAVSFCDLQQVSFVDVATGDWMGTLGAGGDFEIVDAGGAPLGAIGDPQCQHGLEFDGTRLLAYDNGNLRGFSRIAEWELDFTTMTAVLAWTWTEPDWWETTLGDVDRLPGGNVLVAMSHAECFSSNPGDNPTIAEVDPVLGARVWQMQWSDRNTTFYRADFADPCTLFANGKYCPAVLERLSELEAVLPPR